MEILLVRHGPGRGPKIRLAAFRPASYQPLLDDIAARYGQVSRRLRLWETGSGPWPDLSRFHAVVFLLQDPLRERYPACFAECLALADEARLRGIHLVNPPEALSNSIKSRQSRLWREAGIPTPEHHAFDSYDALRQLVQQIEFPAIVRSDFDHSQRFMWFCHSSEQALRLADRITYPGTITPFVDTRNGFQRTVPASPWATFYHKKRVLVFGNKVRYSHVFFSTNPIVSSGTSTFGHYRSLNPVRRWLADRRCREHVALDLEFFVNGDPLDDLMQRAARVLDLEMVALDYSTTAEGGVVLWEANPHFALHLWPFQILARSRRVADRIRVIHDDIQAFFASLMADDRELS